jgi:hypothetical protein
VEGGEQEAEEEAEVRRRPHRRPVHRLLPAPCHSFQGSTRYHGQRPRSGHGAMQLVTVCFKLDRVLSLSSPQTFRYSRTSSACHAGLRKAASTALRLTDHLALSKLTVRGDMQGLCSITFFSLSSADIL